MKKFAFLGIILALLMSVVATVSAGHSINSTINGTLNVSSPTLPTNTALLAVCTTYSLGENYVTIDITANVTGSYNFYPAQFGGSGFDQTVVGFYSEFDASNITNNCVDSNVSANGGAVSIFTVNMTAGQRYILYVQSAGGIGAHTYGNFSINVTGNGNVSPYTAPQVTESTATPAPVIDWTNGDSRENPEAGATAVVYCDNTYDRVLVYGVDDNSNGYFAFAVPYSELPEAPQFGNILIEEFGDVGFYRYAGGMFGIVVGPDFEGKYYTFEWWQC